MFPPRWERKPQRKTLIALSSNTGVTEHGESIAIPDWQTARDTACDGAMVLVAGLAGQRWLPDALTDGASACISRKLGLAALRARHPRDKRRTGWLVDSAAWGGLESERNRLSDSQLLAQVRQCLDTCGTGDFPTPSALGLATIQAHYDRGQPPLYAPNGACDRAIREGLVGGRVDTIRPGTDFGRLFEVDLNSAYPWQATRVPAGGCYAIRRPGHSEIRASYMLARVHASTRRAIGPLPRRVGATVTYPTSGEWTGWYWNAELEAAQEAGYSVQVLHGWEWPEWSTGMAEWALHMHSLRGQAPLTKLVAVAAIGRFLGHTTAQELTEEETDTPYVDAASGQLNPEGQPWPYYLRERPVSRAELLPHIGSYINALVRLATYRRASAEGDALVATNYDAVYTLRRPTEPPSTELGGWKWAELTPGTNGLSVPYPRGLLSAEKTRLPGTPRNARAA